MSRRPLTARRGRALHMPGDGDNINEATDKTGISDKQPAVSLAVYRICPLALNIKPMYRGFELRRCLRNRFQTRDCEQADRIKEGAAGESSFDGSMQTDDETAGSLAIEVGIGF